jgi:hypothetical protein
MQSINFCLSAACTAWVVAEYYQYDVLSMIFSAPFGLNTWVTLQPALFWQLLIVC